MYSVAKLHSQKIAFLTYWTCWSKMEGTTQGNRSPNPKIPCYQASWWKLGFSKICQTWQASHQNHKVSVQSTTTFWWCFWYHLKSSGLRSQAHFSGKTSLLRPRFGYILYLRGLLFFGGLLSTVVAELGNFHRVKYISMYFEYAFEKTGHHWHIIGFQSFFQK